MYSDKIFYREAIYIPSMRHHSYCCCCCFLSTHFCGAIYYFKSGFFLYRETSHWQLDKIRTSNIVTAVRRCQKYAQLLSPAFNHGNKSHKTNSSRATCSWVTMHHQKLFLHLYHVHVYTATIQGWHVFCSEPLTVWLLFEGSNHLEKYSIHWGLSITHL